MLTKPMDVLTAFPVRKTNKQKQAFRDAAQSYLTGLGYECTVEKGSMGSRNMVIGNPDTAKYLVTAHYDTCVGLPFPNLITPCNFWTFMGYQMLLVLILLIPPVIPGVIAGWLTDSFDTGYLVWYACFLAIFALMFFGPANKKNANDNTSGVVTLLEIARTIPEDQRSKVCFVLFDLEEAGLVGSASYSKTHKDSCRNQIVLNLDCVGDGDEIMLFPTKKLRKDPEKMALLRKCSCDVGEKKISLHENGFSVYPSDQRNFLYGVGIAAFRRKKGVGLYCSRIHTNKDTILEEENVTILCERLTALITA